MARSHYVKTWPPFFERLQNEEKSFEVRKNDRDYQVGDFVIHNYFNPEDQNDLRHNTILTKITYLLHGGQFGIKKGYCVYAHEFIKEN